MGKSGAIRTNALDASQISAMETHENRADLVAETRIVRKTPPLVFSPYTDGTRHAEFSYDDILEHIEVRDEDHHLSIQKACDKHTEGARKNAAAKKLCLHSIVQFPTDLDITPETEKAMLAHAVQFIDNTFGGDATFHARLDRDEAGRHAVDVFYAPRYVKKTKRKEETWVSLTKHGKALAFAQFGKRKKEKVDKKTKKRTVVLDKEGNPIMVRCDSSYFQGQALQDAFYQHLTNEMGLDWAIRGSRKIGREPDRLEVEEYKLSEDKKRQDAKIEQENAMLERSAELAQNARELQRERQEKQLEALAEKRDALDEALRQKQQQLDELDAKTAAANQLIKITRELRGEIEPLRAAVEALYEHRAILARRDAVKAQDEHIRRAVGILCEDGSSKERFINAFSVLLYAPGEIGQLAANCWQSALPDVKQPADIREIRQLLNALPSEEFFKLQDLVMGSEELEQSVQSTRTGLDIAKNEIAKGQLWASISRIIQELGKAIATAIKTCVLAVATVLAREEVVPEDELQLPDEAHAFDRMPVETKQAIEEALNLPTTAEFNTGM